jgi:scyllo-inositol 2-dehydrogenase (NADP+)
VLADLGPHLIDQALQLFGWPDSITADIDAQREGARANDMFTLTLGYPGRRVTLASSSLIAAARPRFALYGLEGAFVKYGLDEQEAALREGHAPRDEGFGDEKPGDCGMLTRADATAISLPSQPGRWIDFYRGVVAAIVDGAPPPVDPRDAIAGLNIIEAARRSASERRTIDLHPRAAL